MKTKSDIYVARLLREKPTHTRSGIPLTIHNNGRGVRTYSGRSMNGKCSYYGPTDYPQLFGWKHTKLNKKGKDVNKIKAYFKAFEKALLISAENRLIYQQLVNEIRMVDAVAMRDNKTDIELIKEALRTQAMVRAFGIDTDNELRDIIIKSMQRSTKK